MNMKKELRRSETDVKICGVCGGIGEYLGVDSNVIRLIWVAVSLFAGTGILLYIIAAVLMPKAQSSQKDLKDIIQPEHSSEAGNASGRSGTDQTAGRLSMAKKTG